MIAFNIWNSSLIPLLGVWIYVAQIHVNLSSWFAEFFAGIKPTTSELIVPRYDQLNKFYIVSDWIRCVNLSIRVTKELNDYLITAHNSVKWNVFETSWKGSRSGGLLVIYLITSWHYVIFITP